MPSTRPACAQRRARALIQTTDLAPRLRPVAQANGNAPRKGSARVTRTLPDRVAELEQTAIQEALAQAAGNITHAAPLLGLSRRGLQFKLRRYHIKVDSQK